MKSEPWNGYELIRFDLNGHDSLICLPKNPRPERPWIWRAEFFGAFPSVDLAMLEKGYAVAYCALSDRYGCPEAVKDMHAFFEDVVSRFSLKKKTILFGFSRGGLYAVNYALKYPETVESLYLDAPVMDITSWPGGKGEGYGAPKEWRECLACYHLTEEPGSNFSGNPLVHAEELAALRIPVALVAGDSDRVVPFRENGEPFARRFRAAGGDLLLIVKPGCDHHPHSLDDPSPVVEFLMSKDK